MKRLSNYLIPAVQIRIANVKHQPKRARFVLLVTTFIRNILKQIVQIIKLKRLVVDRTRPIFNKSRFSRLPNDIIHVQAGTSGFIIFGHQ
jgi:hypothetical protein